MIIVIIIALLTIAVGALGIVLLYSVHVSMEGNDYEREN